MITEKHFVLSHSAFWHQLLPTVEDYIRECNLSAPRYQDPLVSRLPPEQRGVTNETGFRLFSHGLRESRSAASLSPATRDECAAAALDQIRRMRERQRAPVKELDAAGMDEAVTIALRLEDFFSQARVDTPIPFPAFPGCGWLDTCCGDILAASVLFEIKAGDRSFRSVDLRQLLCYSALNFAAKSYSILDVCLVNPRSGRYISESLEDVCRRSAGRPAAEVLADIVEYVSEPASRSWG
jgi:hypothetical protein